MCVWNRLTDGVTPERKQHGPQHEAGPNKKSTERSSHWTRKLKVLSWTNTQHTLKAQAISAQNPCCCSVQGESVSCCPFAFPVSRVVSTVSPMANGSRRWMPRRSRGGGRGRSRQPSVRSKNVAPARRAPDPDAALEVARSRVSSLEAALAAWRVIRAQK